MTNAEIARIFKEIADLLEIKGDDSFRISSYRRVARTIADLPKEVKEIAARGELEELPGVGKGSAEKIRVLLESGRLPLREELAREVPESLLELLKIPNFGPRKAAALWKQRGITTLEQLAQAAEAGKLQGLPGFGPKVIQQIREGIDFVHRAAGRTRLGDAWPVAEQFRAAVEQIEGVRKAVTAGSLRRGRETIGDLDLLCVAEEGPAVVQRFTQLPGVVRVQAAGDTKGSVVVRLEEEQERDIQVDLRVVPEESFGAAWMYFTGSKEHNIRLRELALKHGWTLNEYALSQLNSGKVIASRTEEEIYEKLGLPWIPPELREDRGETELKETPELVELKDIRGELHLHTTASDGRDTIEGMIAAAKKRGYEYICITDHSQASVIANGLDPQRMRKHMEAVRKAARKAKDITVWVGAEVDVHADGSLDYPDDLLAELDFVVASVHFGLGRDIAHNTQRTLAAIRNPYVNLIAHPTGRLINRRDAMPLDIEALAREAARTGTALEINAHYYRLDLRDQHARLARDCGATLCLNCDAHAGEGFQHMLFGVLTARRGWVTRKDVLNTRTAKQVAAFVAAKRKNAKRPRQEVGRA